ncbi:acyl-CoA thioester hydrolase YciA [Buchnera aphidicola (Muscaphis stroyani)]|uniref:Acyl-CoA thioester hydrolase YciA n=1 Tax=Buchnera aphidicola (Muscaphis stroyani) TaxID=1241869 RepID=A0A4D6Y5E9_9GAMM|nr:acyl-CoA thioester hydrolase YciA [Buchnera aphidicola]QCI24349.1 acyl-CoA thioester hydrolase YciA [Buchnera aphidicola (Muscaphis stroyani)]
MPEKYKLPKGSLVLKTLTMHSDINSNGNIFGGWIMSQMDMGGAILAKEITGGKVVTVQVSKMNFLKPVSIGDVASFYARCIKLGTSSITINIEVWLKKIYSKPLGQYYCAAEAIFIYVAVDDSGKPRELLPISII